MASIDAFIQALLQQATLQNAISSLYGNTTPTLPPAGAAATFNPTKFFQNTIAQAPVGPALNLPAISTPPSIPTPAAPAAKPATTALPKPSVGVPRQTTPSISRPVPRTSPVAQSERRGGGTR